MSDFWKSQRQLHKQLSLKKADHIAPSLSTYKLLTEQAYKKKPSQKVGTDWNLLLSTDNNKVYQNRNSGEVVNAVSGSKSLKDFTNDGLQYIGFLNNPLQKKRYKESENVINRLSSIDKKRDITLTGHSLGANVNNRLIKDGKASKAINFNSFIPDKSLNIDDDRVINVRNKFDFASKLTKGNSNTINLENNSNSIKSHFLGEINL